MNIPMPDLSFPTIEMKNLKESEERSFRQESLERFKRIDESLIRAEEDIKTIHLKLEEESAARINAEVRAQKAEKKAFWWQLTAITIGALTLIATVAFGLLTALH